MWSANLVFGMLTLLLLLQVPTDEPVWRQLLQLVGYQAPLVAGLGDVQMEDAGIKDAE
jgi:hypothetical protein